MNFLKSIVDKINFNFCCRKNSCGDDIRTKGNVNIDKSININVSKENKIELSEQSKRIYEEFKKSGNMYLSVFFDDEIEFVENCKNGLSINNLDKRMVKADIDNLVKCSYLRFDHEQKNVAVFYTLAK